MHARHRRTQNVLDHIARFENFTQYTRRFLGDAYFASLADGDSEDGEGARSEDGEGYGEDLVESHYDRGLVDDWVANGSTVHEMGNASGEDI